MEAATIQQVFQKHECWNTGVDEDSWVHLCKEISFPAEEARCVFAAVGKNADGKVHPEALLDFLYNEHEPRKEHEPRILLVSDNLPFHEEVIKAAGDHVIVVPVQYSNWQLEDLKKNIEMRAGPPSRQFASVGLLDHGAPGEFCLLASVGGGSIDLSDFASNQGVDIIEFFEWLAAYVRPPQELHTWQSDLSARIDLMACSVAKDDGIKLIQFLEDATRVNWAASIDKTGAGPEVENGFDWNMETEKNLGCIAHCYFSAGKIAQWQHHACLFGGLIGGIIGGVVAGEDGAKLGAMAGNLLPF